jgi:5,5'-dehydrodivanillate O-demethylase oxygenase subunit
MTTITAPAQRDAVDFAHTGPGTLAGRYFRRFWIPVARLDDVPPGRAQPIQLLNEKFTYYRGETGTPHLVGYYCAHRSTQMSTGWVEGDCIRCFYHGWKYDETGKCVEQPAEKETFAGKVGIEGYPTRTYLGLVYAYLGEGEPPEFWRFPMMEQPGELVVKNWDRQSNYWNALENACDQVHVAFVHSNSEFRLAGATREIPRIEAYETEYGILRKCTFTDGKIRLAHTLMPTASLVTVYEEGAGWMPHLSYRIPIDDVSHRNLTVSLAQVEGEAAEKLHAKHKRQADAMTGLPPASEIVEAVVRGDLYLHDLERPDIVNIQDAVALRAQPPIGERVNDRLGQSDVQIIVLRTIWSREMHALEAGGPMKAWTVPLDLVATNG